jgi:hypothetical protein
LATIQRQRGVEYLFPVGDHPAPAFGVIEPAQGGAAGAAGLMAAGVLLEREGEVGAERRMVALVDSEFFLGGERNAGPKLLERIDGGITAGGGKFSRVKGIGRKNLAQELAKLRELRGLDFRPVGKAHVLTRRVNRDRGYRLGPGRDGGFEVGDEKTAERGEENAQEEWHGHFAQAAFGGVEGQRDDGIHNGRAREDDRHHHAGFATGAEGKEDAEGANGANDARDEGPPHAFAAVAREGGASHHQQEQRREDGGEKVGNADEQEGFVTREGGITAHAGLACVQENSIHPP